MARSLLSLKHLVMRLRAKECLVYDFPKNLPSLIEKSPTSEQISKDMNMISKFESHPVFVNYLPDYQERVEDEMGAFIKRLRMGLIR